MAMEGGVLHRFYEPLHWKLPTFIGVTVVWLYLQRPVGFFWASVVALLLLAIVAVVWWVVKRRWWAS
jgi:hypothetical protein